MTAVLLRGVPHFLLPMVRAHPAVAGAEEEERATPSALRREHDVVAHVLAPGERSADELQSIARVQHALEQCAGAASVCVTVVGAEGDELPTAHCFCHTEAPDAAPSTPPPSTPSTPPPLDVAPPMPPPEATPSPPVTLAVDLLHAFEEAAAATPRSPLRALSVAQSQSSRDAAPAGPRDAAPMARAPRARSAPISPLLLRAACSPDSASPTPSTPVAARALPTPTAVSPLGGAAADGQRAGVVDGAAAWVEKAAPVTDAGARAASAADDCPPTPAGASTHFVADGSVVLRVVGVLPPECLHALAAQRSAWPESSGGAAVFSLVKKQVVVEGWAVELQSYADGGYRVSALAPAPPRRPSLVPQRERREALRMRRR